MSITDPLHPFSRPCLTAAYQLVGGVLEDLVMQVGMQHGMPNYLTYADACVNSGDAAEQVRCSGGACDVMWFAAREVRAGQEGWLAV